MFSIEYDFLSVFPPGITVIVKIRGDSDPRLRILPADYETNCKILVKKFSIEHGKSQTLIN